MKYDVTINIGKSAKENSGSNGFKTSKNISRRSEDQHEYKWNRKYMERIIFQDES